MKKLKKACRKIYQFVLEHTGVLLAAEYALVGIGSAIWFIYIHGIKMILPGIAIGIVFALATATLAAFPFAYGLVLEAEDAMNKANEGDITKNETENE